MSLRGLVKRALKEYEEERKEEEPSDEEEITDFREPSREEFCDPTCTSIQEWRKSRNGLLEFPASGFLALFSYKLHLVEENVFVRTFDGATGVIEESVRRLGPFAVPNSRAWESFDAVSVNSRLQTCFRGTKR